MQLIIHFASGKALGEIVFSWSGGCCLAEGQGEGTVCGSLLMKTALMAVACCGSDRNFRSYRVKADKRVLTS